MWLLLDGGKIQDKKKTTSDKRKTLKSARTSPAATQLQESNTSE